MISVFKHLNLLWDLCPVTLKPISWYCYTTILTPCRIVLFPLDLVLSMLQNFILHIHEVRKGMTFMKIKSYFEGEIYF